MGDKQERDKIMDRIMDGQNREAGNKSASVTGLSCPCCGEKPLPCPFCGKDGKIYGENYVGCIDSVNCGGGVDFGHWCGEEDGIPAVHWVVKQWNERAR